MGDASPVGRIVSGISEFGVVGFRQSFQIFFELRQHVVCRLDHCLQAHSFRFLQIVEYLPAPTYRCFRLADPISQLGDCQLCVIHPHGLPDFFT